MSDALTGETGIPRRELEEKFRRIDEGFARIERNFDDVRAKRAEDMQTLTQRHEDSMKLLVNGAQASLNTSWQLNGDPTFHREGFIDEMRRENREIKQQGEDRDKTIEAVKKELNERVDKVEDRLDDIKRLVEYIAKFFKFLGKIADWKVWALGGLAIVVHYFPIPWLQQLFAWLHKFVEHK